MDRDRLIRAALWASVPFNAAAAFGLAFPASPLAAPFGLPSMVPQPYPAMLGAFVALFGGLYAWLAWQPQIPRAMVGFSAIGKLAAFVIVTLLWLQGRVGTPLALAGTGDLLFAVIFLHWLRTTGPRHG
ncbi:MAG TPA: hypothetical protein VGE57_13660 [Solimonas sp.]